LPDYEIKENKVGSRGGAGFLRRLRKGKIRFLGKTDSC